MTGTARVARLLRQVPMSLAQTERLLAMWRGEVNLHRDYKQLETELDAVELEAAQTLIPALIVARDSMLGVIKREFFGKGKRPEWIDEMRRIPKWGAVQDGVGEMLRTPFEKGRRDLRFMIPSPALKQMQSPALGIPPEALRLLKANTLQVSGVTRDDLLKRARNIMLTALRNGEAEEETMRKLFEAWVPYLGDGVDIDTMSRLRTIIRTNTTGAYNQGIVVETRAPDVAKGVAALVYIAVLDQVTTPICTLLHGLAVIPEEERLDVITPPNHFNCRSVLEPIVNFDEVKDLEFLTTATYNKAVGLIQSGFGGEA